MSLDQERGQTGRTARPAFGPVESSPARLAGLPLAVDQAGEVAFLKGLPRVEPRPRTLDSMRTVLYNQTATGPDPVYYMYRGLGWPEDNRRMDAYELRFDLTVVPAGLVGGEYVKTAGHYHPDYGTDGAGGNGPGGAGEAAGGSEGLTYPELYQVLAGRAHYLLQKPIAGGEPGRLEDVVVVETGPGEMLYVPPGYGHVTINPGTETLVMVNVVSGAFSSVYGPYRERHGAAYYEVEKDGQGYFLPNDHYPALPQPRLGRVTAPAALGLDAGTPLYAQLASNPRLFAFLSQPTRDGPVP